RAVRFGAAQGGGARRRGGDAPSAPPASMAPDRHRSSAGAGGLWRGRVLDDAAAEGVSPARRGGAGVAVLDLGPPARLRALGRRAAPGDAGVAGRSPAHALGQAGGAGEGSRPRRDRLPGDAQARQVESFNAIGLGGGGAAPTP